MVIYQVYLSATVAHPGKSDHLKVTLRGVEFTTF